MAFFPLFYIKLDSNTRIGTLNEGLYVMTYQTNTTDVGVLIGLEVDNNRIGHLVKKPDHNQPRLQPFPERQFLGNIQLTGAAQLSEWISPRHQTINLMGVAPNSIEELAVVRRWFLDLVQELRNLKL